MVLQEKLHEIGEMEGGEPGPAPEPPLGQAALTAINDNRM